MNNFECFLITVSFVFAMGLFGALGQENTGKSFADKKLFLEIIPDRIEVLSEYPDISESVIKVRRVNKSKVVAGWIDIRTPIGDDFKTQCKMLKKQGGEYRYLPYVLPSMTVCEFMKKDIYLYPDMAKHSDFPEDVTQCPITVGNYSIRDFNVNTDKVVSAAASSGEYCAEVIFSRDGKTTAIYRAYGYINNV